MVGFADWFKNMESSEAAEILGEANKKSLDFLYFPELGKRPSDTVFCN